MVPRYQFLSQAVHTTPPSAVKAVAVPLPHRHDWMLVEPADDVLFVGQGMQAEAAPAPWAGWYVPGEQLTQAPASVLPRAVEYVPAPQRVHTPASLAPRTPEKVPARHGRHPAATPRPTVAE